MFKLVALLFLVTNGVPAKEPSGALGKNDTFATKEACESFLAGGNGASDKEKITKMIAPKNMVAKFVCVKNKTEDNTI